VAAPEREDAEMQKPTYMRWRGYLCLTLTVVLCTAALARDPLQDTTGLCVRVAELSIAPDKLDRYTKALKEEIETSIRVEPGVLSIYAVAETSNPTKLQFFEIYANEAAYRSHINSPHFQKYADATRGMILSKRLIETTPVLLGHKTQGQD
jgi:quinol monooxygenase YgiN